MRAPEYKPAGGNHRHEGWCAFEYLGALFRPCASCVEAEGQVILALGACLCSLRLALVSFTLCAFPDTVFGRAPAIVFSLWCVDGAACPLHNASAVECDGSALPAPSPPRLGHPCGFSAIRRLATLSEFSKPLPRGLPWHPTPTCTSDSGKRRRAPLCATHPRRRRWPRSALVPPMTFVFLYQWDAGIHPDPAQCPKLPPRAVRVRPL